MTIYQHLDRRGAWTGVIAIVFGFCLSLACGSGHAQQTLPTAASPNQQAPGRDTAVQRAALSQQLADVNRQLAGLPAEQEALKAQIERLSDRYQRTQQQLAVLGRSDALGPILLAERKRRLPDIRALQTATQQSQQRIEEARVAQFLIDDQRDVTGGVTPQAVTRSAAPTTSASPPEQPFNDQRAQLLDRLNQAYGKLITQLIALHQSQQTLLDQVQKYTTLLDETLFWTATSEPLDSTLLGNLANAVRWLTTPANWVEVGRGLWHSAAARPLIAGLALTTLVVLALVRARLRARLGAMGPKLGKVGQDSFGLTLEALAISALLVLPWPLLLGTVGWLLRVDHASPAFAVAAGAGLLHAALLWLTVAALFELCRDQGLAPVHFRWGASSCTVLTRNLRWLPAVTLVPVFLIALTEQAAGVAFFDSLGRVAFVVVMTALAVFLTRVLQPASGILAGILERHRDGIWWVTRHVWFALGVAVPLVLAGLAVAGYTYTALALEQRLVASAWLVIAVVITLNIVVRWLAVTTRRLALARARAKRQALQAARESKEAAEAAGEGAPETFDLPEIDLATIDEQTRQLLYLFAATGAGLGLWLIWADLLPALGIFNNITLWQEPINVGGKVTVQAITLGNLLLTLALLALTLLIARNLPGALEVSVLRRFAMDAGNRYAVTTISRYAITIIGVLVALKAIGIGWSQAQWLIAALGVGLGFGLQEIFANFVSGLILLVERPIRVGDTVTVGNYSGTVSRIRIRATTLTDWDRKETVIPNKTFIAGELTNWTLSDPITRVVIPVGVAYGSDPTAVQRIILDTVAANPMVLEEPAPAVFFLQFGSSSLDFEVRVFVRDLADRIPLTHQLHVGIEQALREHGISIPYPHGELYVHLVDGAHDGGQDLTAGRPAPGAPPSRFKPKPD